MGKNHHNVFQVLDGGHFSGVYMLGKSWLENSLALEDTSGASFCTWAVTTWVSSQGRICVLEQKAKEAEVTSPTSVDCDACVKCIAIWKMPKKKVLDPATSDSFPVSWVIRDVRSSSWTLKVGLLHGLQGFLLIKCCRFLAIILLLPLVSLGFKSFSLGDHVDGYCLLLEPSRVGFYFLLCMGQLSPHVASAIGLSIPS